MGDIDKGVFNVKWEWGTEMERVGRKLAEAVDGDEWLGRYGQGWLRGCSG